MITKKKKIIQPSLSVFGIIRAQIFFLDRFSYKYRDDGRMKNKGEGSFSIFLPRFVI